jgi:hypothetical protein
MQDGRMSAMLAEDRGTTEFTTAASAKLPPPSAGGADLHTRWIMAFLAVGIAARLIRYLLRFPLWGDEAMLATNLVDRDYAGLMQPLNFHQVAPLLFLWIEHTAVKLLGFNEWSLRLFPLVCSLASLFFFERLARLLLRGTALVLAVGIFAVTYSGLRYASETKPYGVDLMVSTLLLWLAVRWWQRPSKVRWLWALTAVTPVALGISYPAVFIAGGVSLTIATVLAGRMHRPERDEYPGWWVWFAYNLILLGSFLTWYKLAVGAQTGAELSVMGRMWEDTFPPLHSLPALVAWLARVHAGPLLAVPVGGDHWGSIGTTLLCLVALGSLIRNRSYRLLVLCSAPFALNLIAAAMHRYPYGGHMRLAMHLAPLISILAAIGLAAILQWVRPIWLAKVLAVPPLTTSGRPTIIAARIGMAIPSPGEPSAWPGVAVMGLLMMLAALSTARDIYMPGKDQQEIRRRDFAVWFWGSMEREHEVVSVSGDLKKLFTPPGDIWENCVSAQFLCNARIYSPRQSSGKSYDLGRVSRRRPLACVQYWSHFSPYDQPAFNLWLDEMKQRYDLVSAQNYPILLDNDYDRVPEPPDRVEVYEFVPKGTR